MHTYTTGLILEADSTSTFYAVQNSSVNSELQFNALIYNSALGVFYKNAQYKFTVIFIIIK